jgi:hypothetical protein
MNTLNEPTAQTVLGECPSLACDCSASHKGSQGQAALWIDVWVTSSSRSKTRLKCKFGSHVVARIAAPLAHRPLESRRVTYMDAHFCQAFNR